MTPRFFRISIHFPFKSSLMWASGHPKQIILALEPTSYSADEVPAIVVALRKKSAKDAVITVH